MFNQNLERYLKSFGKQVMNRSKAGLQKAGKGGALEQSITYRVVKTNEGYDVQFMMNYYGQFVDKGVSGKIIKQQYVNWKGENTNSPGKGFTNKMPPPAPLEKWIKKKGLKGRDKKTGRYISHKSLAFLIGAKIKREGIKSISFFQKPLGLAMRTFNTQMKIAIAKDIEDTMSGINFKID